MLRKHSHRLKDKRRSEMKHAKYRALERFRLFLTNEDLQKICNQILGKSDALFIFKQSKRVSHWRVVYKNTPMQVVYDNKRKAIITFLPET